MEERNKNFKTSKIIWRGWRVNTHLILKEDPKKRKIEIWNLIPITI